MFNLPGGGTYGANLKKRLDWVCRSREAGGGEPPAPEPKQSYGLSLGEHIGIFVSAFFESRRARAEKREAERRAQEFRKEMERQRLEQPQPTSSSDDVFDEPVAEISDAPHPLPKEGDLIVTMGQLGDIVQRVTGVHHDNPIEADLTVEQRAEVERLMELDQKQAH